MSKENIKEGILLDNRPDFADTVMNDTKSWASPKNVAKVAVSVKDKVVNGADSTGSEKTKEQARHEIVQRGIERKKALNDWKASQDRMNSIDPKTDSTGYNKAKAEASNFGSRYKKLHKDNVEASKDYWKKYRESFQDSLDSFNGLLEKLNNTLNGYISESCNPEVKELENKIKKNEEKKEGSTPAQSLARSYMTKALKQKIKDIDEGFKSLDKTMENINTSISAFGTLPNDLAGKEQPSKSKKGKQKKAVLGYKFVKIRQA